MPHTVDQKKAAAFARPEAKEMLGNLTVGFGLSGLQIRTLTPRLSLDNMMSGGCFR